MKTRKLIQSLAAGVIGVIFASGAYASDSMSMSQQRAANAPLGTPAEGALADRIVKLGPASRYLNVYRGDTITIVSGEKAFTWKFDTLGTPVFELAKIAPRDFGAGQITVYVDISQYDQAGEH